MNSAADLTELRKAVAFIPAHNRETWIKIGMAIKSELGEGGFELCASRNSVPILTPPSFERDRHVVLALRST